MPLQYLKKEVRDKNDFLHADIKVANKLNIKVVFKYISTLWIPKFPTRSYYDYLGAWWSILKILKETSL